MKAKTIPSMNLIKTKKNFSDVKYH